MNGHLRILHLEDSKLDAELIAEKLREDGLSSVIDWVETKDEFASRLAQGGFDIILADYTLPSFDGLSALAMAREKYPDLPVIFVSGTIGEDRAVETYKNGATDYVLKGHLSRLAPSVHRALKETRERLERRRAEESLRESEARYRALFENSIDAVLLTVPDGTILAANQAACRMFGLSEAEICAVGRSGLVDATDQRLPVLLEERTRTGVASGELTFIRKDGTKFPGEVSSAFFKDKDGYTKSSMVIRDITERKQKEEDLQRLNRTLLARSKSSQAMMSARNEDWYLNEVCRIIVEDCGHALVWIGFAEQDEGRTVRPVAHAGLEEGYLDSMKITWSDTERGRGPVGTAIRTGKPSVFRNLPGNPAFAPWREEAVKRGYASVIGVPLLAEGKAFGSLNIYSRHRNPFSEDEVQLLKDLAADLSYGIAAIRLRTAQAEAEVALRESEEKYRHIVENLGKEYLFYRHDTNGVLTYVSPSATDMLGYSQPETLAHYAEFLSDNPVNKEVVRHTDLSIQGLQQPPFEVEIVHKDSSLRWLEVTEYPVRNQDGCMVAVEGIARDITERKRIEEALRASERQYRQLVDNALVGVYKTTLEGKFIYVNNTLARIFECENADEMLRLPVGIRYKRPEDREAFLNVLKEQGKAPYYEVEVPTKTGKLKTIVISAVLEDNIISGMVADITERKHLEAQLRHAQKMDAVGTLAGGIAHDFNNILNVIIGYGTMVLDRMEADSLSKGQMNEVLAAAERAAVLTKRLLVFSRKQLTEVNPINVNETVISIQKMLARIICEDIVFQLDLEDRSMVVMADAGQIEQVLMNLVSNARDAMPNGGRLTIGTGLQAIDNEYIAVNGYGTPGMYAFITVADTGQGMDAETQKKIFEPFFTTKGIGEGTGLGLAISYGIIKQHSGYIKAYSEPGHGTVFKIYLPLIEESAGMDNRTEAAVSVRGGNETVLVAEDDAYLRKLTRIVLESFGYSVITAEDGEDAITKFMENRERIHLVILDMIMPKKNGKEVSAVLRKASPGIKILLASGYTMDIIKNKELTESGFDFIHKPVQPQDLLRKVREVLDK